jgi:anti-anti-sigma factor
LPAQQAEIMRHVCCREDELPNEPITGAVMEENGKVEVIRDETGDTIVATGALDLYTNGFKDPLNKAAESAENVVLDLRGAYFIDTAIIAYMAGAAKRLLKRQKRLKVLLKEGTHPLRTLQITGLATLMDLVVDEPGPE